MLGRVTLVFVAAATLAVGAAGCSVSADVAALRDAGYGSSGGGYTSGSSSGGGTSSSGSSGGGGSSSGSTSSGAGGDDATPPGDDASPAGDDASSASDDGGLDSAPAPDAPDAPADAPLLVDSPPPPIDAPASDGLSCTNLGCFDVFDCAIYHPAEFGPCHFTACVNLVCQ